MHYYIDGYNILFYLYPDLEGIDDINRKRNTLLEILSTKKTSCQLTIIFDSNQQEEPETSIHKHIEVYYASKKFSADDLILSLIQERNPKNGILVTSDISLAKKAKYLDMKIMSTEKFVKWLQHCPSKNAEITKTEFLSSKKSSLTSSGYNDYLLQAFEKKFHSPQNTQHPPLNKKKKRKK